MEFWARLSSRKNNILAFQMINYVEHFTQIYETCAWDNNKDPLYRGSSGGGSAINYNKDSYVPFLRRLLSDLEVTTVADIGCGDFLCGPLIYDTDNGVTVHGYDAYAAVVEANKARFPQHKFTHLDVFVNRAQIEGADLCIIKDVLQHWLIPDIYTFLNDIVTSGKFKHILVCNCCGQTEDDPDNRELSTGLSCDFLPLKRYGATKLFKYGTKEVSLITI